MNEIGKDIADRKEILVDVVSAKTGYDPLGSYTEYFYLPIVGPTSYTLHQRLYRRFEALRHPYKQDIGELAQELGLMESDMVVRTSANSPIVRSLVRVIHFGLAQYDSGRFNLLDKAAILSWPKQKRLT